MKAREINIPPRPPPVDSTADWRQNKEERPEPEHKLCSGSRFLGGEMVKWTGSRIAALSLHRQRNSNRTLFLAPQTLPFVFLYAWAIQQVCLESERECLSSSPSSISILLSSLSLYRCSRELSASIPPFPLFLA